MAYTPSPEEPAFRLSSMAPPRRRRTGLIAAVIAAGVLVVAFGAGAIGYALAGKNEATPAAAATSAAAEPTASPSPSAGDRARRACERLVAASRVEDVYTAKDLPGLKEAADAAAGSDNTSVVLSGMLLQDVLTDVQAEHDAGDDSEWPGRIKKFVQGLRSSCATNGYPV